MVHCCHFPVAAATVACCSLESEHLGAEGYLGLVHCWARPAVHQTLACVEADSAADPRHHDPPLGFASRLYGPWWVQLVIVGPSKCDLAILLKS